MIHSCDKAFVGEFLQGRNNLHIRTAVDDIGARVDLKYFYKRGQEILIRMMNQKLRKRRDFSYKRLNEIPGISTAKPDGAFYIFPKIEAMDKGLWKDDKAFVLDVLKETHVLIVNGSGFCPIYGKNHFRAVILPPIKTLEKAFNNLEDFMKKKLKENS